MRSNPNETLALPATQAHAANQNKGSIYMVFEYMDHDLTGLAGASLLLALYASHGESC